jgi:REP-associated tyrosine transposase
MARRPRLFAPGLLYHVIVRGNQRQKTFLSDQDYRAYLERLAKYRERYGYNVHAYCLMPNHVHLLLESSDQPLAKLMQGLQQSYSQYFNISHRKVGHVFQGRYKAIICAEDEYLVELVRYIHLNPVRAGMVKAPERYRYSGHQAYLQGKAGAVIDPVKVLKLFGGKAGYRRFVRDGMAEGHKEEYYDVEDQRFLGAEGFGDRVQGRAGATRRVPSKRSIEAVVRQLAKELGVSVEAVRSRERGWGISKARTMIAYVLARRLGYGLKEVASYLQRDMATVGTLLSRLYDRMQSDEKLLKRIDKLSQTVES